MFDLTMLNGTNGFRVEGLKTSDSLGVSVSTAGDINGDGRSDVVLGAHFASPGGRGYAGTAYVIFGQVSGWPASFDLATLNGTNGFSVEGLNMNDRLGRFVSTAGDMNSDGLSDLILGAYWASPGGRTNAGMAYVIFGQASGWPASFNLTTLDGSNGFLVEGLNANDQLGRSVSTAGDMNGDGLSDLVLGAYFASYSRQNSAGTAYVIFGQNNSSWPASFNLTFLDGSNGFLVEGENANDHLSVSASTAGDTNGDGLSDLVLGAYAADPNGRVDAGTAYVIFGQASSWPASFNLTTLNGTNGFRVEGLNSGDYLGIYVSTAGDMNGDGRSDLVLGADLADPGGRVDAGTAYVMFGQVSGWPAVFDLTTLNGSNGFRVEGMNASDWLTYSVSTAGDMNDDGLSDLVLGAPSSGGQNQVGMAYVMFGQASNWPASFDLTTLNGINGFRMGGVNAGDELGVSVCTAGDINDDGRSDLVLGPRHAAPSGRVNAGTVYILFGTPIRPPQLVHNISDQTAELEKPFGFQIASNTFNDSDGDTLKYSATQSGNSSLPSWLRFDATKSLFFGTPNQTSITSITVTATDPYGLTARGDFNLTVRNHTPTPDSSNIEGIIGGIVGGVAAALGGLAGAAYLAYKRGFFASDRGKNTASAAPDTEIELTKKTAISLAG